MWNTGLSLGCLCMVSAWILAIVFVTGGALAEVPSLGQAGIVMCGLGVTLAIIRDNARTRAAVARATRRGWPESEFGPRAMYGLMER